MNKDIFSSNIETAIVRRPGKNLAEGISPAVGIPDIERALQQHRQYCDALEKCGVRPVILPSDPAFPDGCFVNDMAVVTDTMAIITNFSASSPRQGEQQATASYLAETRFLKFITAPGFLDASDVLRIGNNFYISPSDHTNQEGAAQAAFFLKEYGYEAVVIDISAENIGHLGASALDLGRDRILIREEISRHFSFISYDKVIVPKEEKGAANAAFVNGTVLLPAGYPKTLSTLKEIGIPVIEVTLSEFEKMNGGLNCLSLRLPRRAHSNVVTLSSLKKSAA